jgi:peptidoglycan/LPS O-acetylase OafA/YrhL
VLIAIPAGLAKSISWLGVVNFAPCFISGVISYVLWFRVAHKLKATILPVVLSALFCLYMVLGRNSQTGGAWVVCFALGLSLPWIADSQSMLLNTICHRIAKYSYGIYLLHDICISITGYILGKHVHWIMGVGVSLVSTGLLSMIAYHIIEEPLIRLGAQISKQIFRQAPISTSQAN